ncbi:hypothetical protein ACIRU8_15030 [Streptomyces sp. NPDC101175]|uniref:hypothetical protein n=1 Tax=Streptomyces sp. NPDC101175 TaxID=3366123 RepID=UPI00383610B5
MESLADRYASLKGLEDEDRPARFRELLWDGLQKYATKNGMADIATWVRDLFFWPDDPNRFVIPRDLLDKVRIRLGYSDRDTSFWRLRDHEFEEFGAYLAVFVNAEVEQANERIKADRAQERAEKERLEAQRALERNRIEARRLIEERAEQEREAQRIKEKIEQERIEAERAKKEAKKQERAEKESVKKERQKQQRQLWRERRELELQEAREKAAKIPMRIAALVVLAAFVLVPLFLIAQSQISTHQAGISHAWSTFVQWVGNG